ncbi:MAG: ROK family protein [Synergistaceae bacterium]|jgi:glucokinase|nr:ROK family protein [Synergistaceae bacterium]
MILDIGTFEKTLNTEGVRAIGVDLGGHKVVAGRVEGNVIRERFEEPTDPSRQLTPVIAQVARMARELGADKDTPVGICIPGGIDAARERSLMVANFEGWNGLPLRRMFEDELGQCVAIENDANAYALGEGFAGAAKGMTDYVVLTLGTGIGGGIVVGGRLLTGAHGIAGELGHMVLGHDEPCGPGCRGFGHLEAMCGADALERKAREMGLPPVLKDLWLMRDPRVTDPRVTDPKVTDPRVVSLWDLALNDIARGIATLVHILDPQAVIVGGGLRKGAGFMELLEGRIYRYLGEPFKQTMNLCSSALDTDAPIFGAAASALARWSRSSQ